LAFALVAEAWQRVLHLSPFDNQIIAGIAMHQGKLAEMPTGAAEALKCLARVGEPLIGRLLLWDGLRADARVMKVPRDPVCPVCGPAAFQAG